MDPADVVECAEHRWEIQGMEIRVDPAGLAAPQVWSGYRCARCGAESWVPPGPLPD